MNGSTCKYVPENQSFPCSYKNIKLFTEWSVIVPLDTEDSKAFADSGIDLG